MDLKVKVPSKTERENMRRQFRTAKREALQAANELYDRDYFPDFNGEVVGQLNAVILPDSFDISVYLAGMRQIGQIMTKAAATFNWDSPLLDLVPDVR